jgi:hypothetical protein
MSDDRPSVKPFRHYQGMLSIDPPARLIVLRSNLKKEDPRILMANGAVDVVDLTMKLLPPIGDEHLNELRHAVNMMRVTVPVAEAPSFHFPSLKGASQRVESALATLRKDLPKLIEFHREFDGSRATQSAEIFEAVLSAAGDYFDQRWIAWGGKMPARRHTTWHDDAIYLWFLLERASRGELVFSHPLAPAVEFIDEALSRANVRHGDRGAIAQCLARYERNTKSSLKRYWKNVPRFQRLKSSDKKIGGVVSYERGLRP